MHITLRNFFLAAVVAAPTSALAFDNEAAKQFCAREWTGDFQMQAYCIKQQKEGFDIIEAIGPSLDETMQTVLANCRREWPVDQQMTAYCLTQQIDARQALSQEPIGVPEAVISGIRSLCAQEWGNDFQMQNYCIGQQVEGWRLLNN